MNEAEEGEDRIRGAQPERAAARVGVRDVHHGLRHRGAAVGVSGRFIAEPPPSSTSHFPGSGRRISFVN